MKLIQRNVQEQMLSKWMGTGIRALYLEARGELIIAPCTYCVCRLLFIFGFVDIADH